MSEAMTKELKAYQRAALEIFAQHKAEGAAEHGSTFAGCYCDPCRIAREANPALHERPKCATCGAEKTWDGYEAKYVCGGGNC